VLDAFGTSSEEFVRAELNRLMGALQNCGESYASEEAMNAAIAVVDGTRPESETAAMLASQMAVTHDLAMNLLGRTRRAETLEHLHAFGTLLTKLQRTFTLQIEALEKLKRGGEQTMRVEHVHVYHGGQAVVGQVTAKREGEGGNDGRRSQTDGTHDVRTIAFASGVALLGQDEGGDAVPESGGEGQETMQATRRGNRNRSTAR
jgi:hypothetical protein